jgi:hypothetical protein
VLINILDINDNPPKFYSCGSKECVEESQFRGEIQENSAGTLQINMTVKDLDQVLLKIMTTTNVQLLQLPSAFHDSWKNC